MSEADEVRDVPTDPAEEAEYWKLEYETKALEMADLEDTFEEFQQTSKEVEEEMERDLERAEEKIKYLTTELEKYKQEYRDQQSKNRTIRRQSTKQLTTLEDDLGQILNKEKKLRFRCQKLEQENDDLEQRHRQSQATIEYLQERLDQAVEHGVMTQAELEEVRASSNEVIQRLRDDLRDQRLELQLKSDQLETLKRTLLLTAPTPSPSSAKKHRKRSKTTMGAKPTPKKSMMTRSGGGRAPFLSSTGYDIPLHMISDMLGMVTEIERCLQADAPDTVPA